MPRSSNRAAGKHRLSKPQTLTSSEPSRTSELKNARNRGARRSAESKREKLTANKTVSGKRENSRNASTPKNVETKKKALLSARKSRQMRYARRGASFALAAAMRPSKEITEQKTTEEQLEETTKSSQEVARKAGQRLRQKYLLDRNKKKEEEKLKKAYAKVRSERAKLLKKQRLRHMRRAQNNLRRGGRGLEATLNLVAQTVHKTLVSLVSFAAKAVSALASFVAVAGLPLVFIGALILPLAMIIGMVVSSQSNTTGASRFAQIVHEEYQKIDESGSRYQSFAGFQGDWCAMFVAYNADKAGLIAQGVYPGGVYYVPTILEWYRNHTEAGEVHEGFDYDPKPGDLVMYDWASSDASTPDHIGVVVEVGEKDGHKYWIADHGNPAQEKVVYKDDSGSYRASANQSTYNGIRNIYFVSIKGANGGGKIDIPSEYGNGGYSITAYDRFYPIWANGTRQRIVADMWAAHGRTWSDHIATLNGRYLIACTTTFGQVGDMVDFYLDDGTLIPCIIADAKNPNDPGCNEYGHSNGQNVIEFEVEDAHYQAYGNPGSSRWMPEWAGKRVASATNNGSIL